MIQSRCFDLVLTALELDDGSGETLIGSLAASESKDSPIVVITSTDSIEMRERLFALGVADYLLKSEIDEARLRRYLDALAAEDELSRFMRSLRIAVLDDSKVILKIVSSIFRMNGFQFVTLFESPVELLDSKEKFDLYLTDIVLPGMTGEQVVSKLRSAGSDAIIICMSQFATEKPLANILLAGADDYIAKPFDVPALVSRIKVNVRAFQLKKRLELMAVTDGLTGLYNHRYSYERLEEEIDKAKRYKRSLALIMLDVDDFKLINDSRGHRVGDEVLAGIANAFKSGFRSTDIIGRYGGEEFIAILPESTLDSAKAAAEKARRIIAELPLAGGDFRATVSIGVALLEEKEKAGSLVNRADAHLYLAKRKGKNRVEG